MLTITDVGSDIITDETSTQNIFIIDLMRHVNIRTEDAARLLAKAMTSNETDLSALRAEWTPFTLDKMIGIDCISKDNNVSR